MHVSIPPVRADVVEMSKQLDDSSLFEKTFAETDDLDDACLAAGLTIQEGMELVSREGVLERIQAARLCNPRSKDEFDVDWVLKSIKQTVEYALADSKYSSAIQGLALCTKILKMVDNDTTNVVVVQPPQIIKLFGVATEVPFDPNLIIEGELEK